jgi:hypothetical protein
MQRLPDEVDAFIMEELRRGIPRAMILKHIEDSYLTRFMDDHSIYDPDLARRLFSGIPTPRGAWATLRDVYNRQRKLDLATWMRDVSELRSLLKWYLDVTTPVIGFMFGIPGGNPDDAICYHRALGLGHHFHLDQH